MAQIGNKQNSYINGEWAKHVRGSWKKHTSRIRRQMAKADIKDRLENE